MTKDEALRLAKKAFELGTYEAENRAIKAIDQAIEQVEKQEPVLSGLPMVIAGAIYDFAGYLTTRPKVIEIGSAANSSPMVDLIKAWAAERGLSLDAAAVLSWQTTIKPEYVASIDISKERVDEMQKQRHEQAQKQEPVAWKDRTYGNLHHQDFGNSIPLYTSPPQRQPLTDEEIVKIASDPCLYIRGGDYRIDIARAIEAAHGIVAQAPDKGEA